jgi:putative ABC transport system permease protein
MGMLCQDVRYGFRMLARNPGFAALVVGILAVGIAANTALFSVVNAVMLRPLPYKDSQRLVTIWEEGSLWGEGFRARAYFPFLREKNEVFEEVAGSCHRVFYVGGLRRRTKYAGRRSQPTSFPCSGSNPFWVVDLCRKTRPRRAGT